MYGGTYYGLYGDSQATTRNYVAKRVAQQARQLKERISIRRPIPYVSSFRYRYSEGFRRTREYL